MRYGPSVMAPCRSLGLADEIAAVHGEDVPVDVVRGAAGQKDDRAHEVDRLAPTVGGDVIEHPAAALRIAAGVRGDRRRVVAGCDAVDLDVVLGQLVTVGLGEAGDPVFGLFFFNDTATTEKAEHRADVDDL